MMLFPAIEVPNMFCKFSNYTQSIEGLTFLMWVLALYGLLNIMFHIYSYIRTCK